MATSATTSTLGAGASAFEPVKNRLSEIRNHADVKTGEMLGEVLIDKTKDSLLVDADDYREDVELQIQDENGNVVETTTVREFEKHGKAKASIMGTVRLLGGAMIGIAILVVVLTEVFSLEAMEIDEGPFSGVMDSLESTGGAALGLLVIGLLVLAANRVMGFFGSGGF